jgi:dolichyl-phosphate beta-glucosyltransferase
VPPHQALALVLVQHVFQLSYTTSLGAAVCFFDRAVPRFGASRAPDVPQADVVARTRANLKSLASNLGLEPPGARPSLSIVIPAYNEKDRLPRTALQALRWCRQRQGEHEIIIVDDGSTDDTLAVAELLEDHDRCIRKIACPHKGKGAAVRMGMLNARGRYVLFMDADGATPLTEITKLIAKLDQGFDVAIGSRVLQMPGEATVQTSWHRKFIGRVFALFVNVFAVSGIADTQCGFKMFRRDATKSVFGLQRLDGFAFDVEILFIARRLGLSISEVPVNWHHQPGSKVNIVTDSLYMLRDLMRVRWLHKRAMMAKPSLAPVGGMRS